MGVVDGQELEQMEWPEIGWIGARESKWLGISQSGWILAEQQLEQRHRQRQHLDNDGDDRRNEAKDTDRQTTMIEKKMPRNEERKNKRGERSKNEERRKKCGKENKEEEEEEEEDEREEVAMPHNSGRINRRRKEGEDRREI